MQLVLDEKQHFVEACREYLRQYRQWHELMNYEISRDDPSAHLYSEFDSLGAAVAYRAWRRDFDYAYGNILLLSSDDFGPLTMEVSTVLYSTLFEAMDDSSESSENRKKLLADANVYFLSKWLVRAKAEILQFNSGELNELPIPLHFEQERMAHRARIENDSAYEAMYEGLLRAEEHLKRTTPNWRKDSTRILTHEEFIEWMRSQEE